MKIFITGGSGFIGSNFILKQLSITNNEILNYDKLTYSGNANNLFHIKNNPNYQFICGDICNKKKLSSAFGDFQPDICIHFAAESHVDRSIDSPMQFINTNILGTATLLEVALDYFRNNKNFILFHISTDEVFGSLGNVGGFSEDSPYKPNSPYSASKASADHLVRSWHKTYRLPSIITNCSNNFGPYQFPEKFIPLLIINCVDEKLLPIYGKGKNIRDWLHVEDHCDAIYSIIEYGVAGETYNVGGNNEKSNIEIATTICSIMDKLNPRNNGQPHKKLITYVEDRPGHDFRYAIDNSKIINEIGWKPKENFDAGIEKTIKWYLSNKNWWRKIQNKTYNQERLGLIK